MGPPGRTLCHSSRSPSRGKHRRGCDDPLELRGERWPDRSQVNYLARGNGYTLYLTPDQAVLDLQSPSTSTYSPLTMQLIGSNPAAQPVGLDLQAGQSNYFVGNNPSQWITNIANYGQVEYQQVYPGVTSTITARRASSNSISPSPRGPTPARCSSSRASALLARRQGPDPPAPPDGEERDQEARWLQIVDGVQQSRRGHFGPGQKTRSACVRAMIPRLRWCWTRAGYSTSGGSLGDIATASPSTPPDMYITGETGTSDSRSLGRTRGPRMFDGGHVHGCLRDQ